VDTAEVSITGIGSAKYAVVTVGSIPAGHAYPRLAPIPDGAFAPIVTNRVIGKVDAPHLWHAAIVGTEITIVAIQSILARPAATVDAPVTYGAGIAVVALDVQSNVLTTSIRGAAIPCAGITVIAIWSGVALTSPLLTLVDQSALVTVVAGSGIIQMLAPFLGRAVIGGAAIAIITIEGSQGLARAVHAHVPVSAGIAVIARGLLRCGETLALFAGILRTGVAIITNHGRSGETETILTGVIERAGISVRAATLNILVGASTIQQTEVLGAGIIIITLQRARSHADSINTMIVHGAGVTIVAKGVICGRVASKHGVTEIVSTDVGIVAILGGARDALTLLTAIENSADTAILTGDLIIRVLAPLSGVATLIRADIAIVAVRRHPGNANAAITKVTDGACVGIVTGESVIYGQHRALPCCGVAVSDQARPIEALRLGTLDHAFLDHCTLIGGAFRITEEDAIAFVTIFQGAAIAIHLAVTVGSHALALSTGAFIGHGTGISIIAVGHVVFK